MLKLTVNGEARQVDVDPDKPLLWVLRDQFGLTGTKYGCGIGVCGACLVWLDGVPNHACMVPVAKVGGRAVTSIEGLPAGHPVVAAWIAEQVPQCGYCQPAQIMAAAALLAARPHPTDADIDAAMSGVLCRCGTYARIRRAVHAAAHPGRASVRPLEPPQLLADLPADAGAALDDWIWIDRAGRVTLMINHSEMGQGALTGLVALFAEELDIDLVAVRTVFSPASNRYRNGLWGAQFTGGSSSIRGEWQRLREVAARTRLRLVQAAAQRWAVPPEECRSEAGCVIHAASGRRVGYGELAGDAAQQPVPRRAPLKRPENFRVIGRPIARLDIPAMATGGTRYGIDCTAPGMLCAAVARCPVVGGRVNSVDDRAALAIKGVRHVIRIAAGVAVAADDFWSALRGRDALKIAWSCGAAARVEGAALRRQLVAAVDRPGRVAKQAGDARRALAGDGMRLVAIYETPYLAHATIEPMNCLADVRADGCDVWVGTQNQAGTQEVAAQVSGLPQSAVRVHTQFLGGGFGRRLETDFVAEAVELSQALGRPVQVLWSRADDLQHDKYRPAHAARLEARLGADGLPAAWLTRVAGPALALDGIDVPYAAPHLREEHAQIDTPVPTGAWRSVGASNNVFAIESFVDELAHLARRDPVDYRLALLGGRPRHAAVLRAAAQRAGWGEALPAGCARGVAVYEGFGSAVAQVAQVRVEGSAIHVERVVCAIDCGQTALPDAVRAQVEGGIALGLSAALKEEITIAGGRVQQSSFDDYSILTLAEMPRVEVHIMPGEDKPGGVGEPGVPPVAAAVANAVFAACGRRLRRLPLRLGE